MYYVCIDEKNGRYELSCREDAEGAAYSEKFESLFSARRRMKMLQAAPRQMLKDLVQAKAQGKDRQKRVLKTKSFFGLSPLEEPDKILKQDKD